MNFLYSRIHVFHLSFTKQVTILGPLPRGAVGGKVPSVHVKALFDFSRYQIK